MLRWPVAGFVLTQGFGCTGLEFEPVDAACPGGHFHAGIDLATLAGTDVRAARAGLVIAVLHDQVGYGTHVVLDHGGGVTTLYAHLQEASVHSGDLLLQGDRLGWVGSTGNSTGPHLHFEVRVEGRPVDPEAHLPARTFRGDFQ
jgi:murein DD-endopeptidase MepM/ murein hydrolase activator NlpD